MSVSALELIYVLLRTQNWEVTRLFATNSFVGMPENSGFGLTSETFLCMFPTKNLSYTFETDFPEYVESAERAVERGLHSLVKYA